MKIKELIEIYHDNLHKGIAFYEDYKGKLSQKLETVNTTSPEYIETVLLIRYLILAEMLAKKELKAVFFEEL